MTEALVTVAQIEAQISDAREHLSALDKQAQDLSLPAVAGDEAAAAALADVNRSIRQVTADVAVLERAKIAAGQQEAHASAGAAAAYRAQHLEIAKGHASEIVSLASRSDQLIDTFKTLLADLAEAERKLWSALQEAKERPHDAVIGRRGLPRLIIERMSEITRGLDRFRTNQRPVAVIASVAWSELLESDKVASNDDI